MILLFQLRGYPALEKKILTSYVWLHCLYESLLPPKYPLSFFVPLSSACRNPMETSCRVFPGPKLMRGRGRIKEKKIIRRLSLSIPGPKTRVNMTEEVLKGRKLKYACIVGTLGCQASLQCHDFLVGPLPSIVTGTVSVNLPSH